MTHADWVAQGTHLFGPDPMCWRFVCPACHIVTSAGDWKAAGAPEEAIGFACIGRYLAEGPRRDALGLNPKGLPTEGPGPCNYTGGGLFNFCPVRVLFSGNEIPVFAFADAETKGGAA